MSSVEISLDGYAPLFMMTHPKSLALSWFLSVVGKVGLELGSGFADAP